MKVDKRLDNILKELIGNVSTEREKHLREMFIEIITEQESNKKQIICIIQSQKRASEQK